MPTLVIRSPDGSEREHAFQGELLIGRHESNGLVLAEGGVSRRHAKLTVRGSEVLIEDLGSANGTYVDGKGVKAPTPITAQNEVALGDYVLRLKAVARKPSKPAPPIQDPGEPMMTRHIPGARQPGTHSAKRAGEIPAPLAKNRSGASGARPALASGASGPKGALVKGGSGQAAALGAGPVLRGLTGPWLNKTYPLTGTVVIGRQAPAQVLVEDDSVSRRHAELEVTEEGVVLRDLGSANGTLLNGAAVAEEILLEPGDVLQVGMIELAFEWEEPEVLAAPTRRGGSSRGRPAAETPSGGKGKLVIVAAGVGALLVAAGVAKVVMKKTGPVSTAVQPVGPQDLSAQKSEYLTECRSFASTDMGTDPDWLKAEAACNKALDIDPINEEANRLIRRIEKEKEAAAHFDQGQKEMARLREDEALDQFGKIPPDSFYYLKAKPKVVEVANQAKQSAGEDCTHYARDKFWKEAYPRCERYMTFACQDMTNDELYPPLGFKVKLDGRLRRRQWRPKDKMYLLFLKVRAKVKPDDDMWRCPEIKILRKPPAPEDNGTIVAKEIAKRYHDKYIQAAMMDYWNGSGSEAAVILEKIRDDMRKAPLHATADAMRKDISDADQLFKAGEGQLQQQDVEKAAEPFDEALQLDQKLMGDLAISRPSFYRRNMEQDIAHAAFVSGKVWSDRGDARKACLLFKIGFKYYKADNDLNRAIGWCSSQGAAALAKNPGCGDMPWVLDVAVDGDGIKEKVEQLKKAEKCR